MPQFAKQLPFFSPPDRKFFCKDCELRFYDQKGKICPQCHSVKVEEIWEKGFMVSCRDKKSLDRLRKQLQVKNIPHTYNSKFMFILFFSENDINYFKPSAYKVSPVTFFPPE